MEVDFGVLAMWIYSTRYRKFREASPLDDYVAKFTAKIGPPTGLKHVFDMENGHVERNYVRNIGQDILRGKDIKHMMRQAWSLYGIPKYLSGELHVDIFNSPERLAGADKSVEYVIDLFQSIKLPDVHTVVYSSTRRAEEECEVSVTDDSLITVVDSWGWVKTSSTGFECNLTKPDVRELRFLPVTEEGILGLIRTHLFISSWISYLQGKTPDITTQFNVVSKFVHDPRDQDLQHSTVWRHNG